MSFRRKLTSLLVLGVTGVGALSIWDDYLIFHQCSKGALDIANSDSELKTILGENIAQGPLYAATMGLDREGNSAQCSFPVTGSLDSGNLHLRAVRYEEKYKWLTPYFPGFSGGRWEVLVLEALVPTNNPPARQRLNLIQRKPKIGDGGGGGPCGTPSTIGHHEV
ncbi:uncharacterized protein [Physcomitrium patens]|nr:uncharacterized protein LOC112295065 isoform X2 [Physcomitrium patens]XP_024401973.1 uncharacterized protein LOC112295065 isoform X2 [Physcomitrium patens]|eukprot:XP_024401972.1 uncharacterized protein LOC112295065 isoform X2 [Physcomitrella patens]